MSLDPAPVFAGPEPPPPASEVVPPLLDLEADAARTRSELTNASAERTDVMLLGGNYLELRVEGGSFDSVEPGGFYRWELLEEKNGEMVRAFRSARILRLHAPLLEGGERLVSGPIRISGGQLTATGSFVVPGGTVVAAEVASVPP